MKHPFFGVMLAVTLVCAGCASSSNSTSMSSPDAGVQASTNPAPMDNNAPAPTSSAPSGNPGAQVKPWNPSGNAAPAATAPQYPKGIPVPGKPGLVKSPYAEFADPINVSGLPSGTLMKCPYTFKIFIVP